MHNILFLLLFIGAALQASSPAPQCSEVLEYAAYHLPQQGELKFSDGFVYVKVDDGYIHELVQLLFNEGFEEPPYFGKGDLVGSHITVIYPDEVKRNGITAIDECGQIINFTLQECQVVHPPRWNAIDEVYFIVVNAPELDTIRQKYGLPKREFNSHITIGVKPFR